MTAKREYTELSSVGKSIANGSRIGRPRKKRLNRDEAKALQFIQKDLGIDVEEAKLILFQDTKHEHYLKYHKVVNDVKMINLMEKLNKGVTKATKDGDLTGAKNGTIAIKLLSDKLYPQSKGEAGTIKLNQGIAVKVDFPFKPYKTTNTINATE